MTTISIRALTLVATLAAGSGACDQLQEGKQGNLAFELTTDDRLFPFSFGTPLAEGMSVDINVYASKEDRTPVTITDASASPAGIVEIGGKSGQRLTLSGVASGTAEVAVQTSGGDDSFDIQVRPIVVVDLSYPGFFLVPETPPVRVLEGGTARFMQTLKGADDRVLVGYGAASVTFTPATAATRLVTNDVAHVGLRFDELGEVTVTGQGDQPLTVMVVPQAELTTLSIEGLATLDLGQDLAFVVRGVNDADERLLGLSGLISVVSTTPEVCTISESPRLGDSAYTARPLKSGDCTVTASLGAVETSETVTVAAP